MPTYCVHMDVGVRELKAHLSDYLDRAAQGETICVTDRGVPKAMLVPIQNQGTVAVGIAEGWIRAGSGNPVRPVRRSKSGRTVLAVLAEDRDQE